MNRQDLQDQIIQSLSAERGRGEAASVARIVREDLFPGPLLAELTTAEEELFKTVLQKLADGHPVQYVVGTTIFYGYRFAVNSQVLIPRPETEELVYQIVSRAIKSDKPLKIIDIGTGSGCIALTLKKELPTAEVWAVDFSPGALVVARQNALDLNASVNFLEMDFLNESRWVTLPGDLDWIVSNPPYIPPSEKAVMPAGVLQHEPDVALFTPEEDPLIFYRKLCAFSISHLANSGRVAVEINEFRAADTQAIFAAYFKRTEIIHDLQGKPRMLLAEALREYPKSSKG